MKIISKYNNTWMAYFGFQILFHILTVVGLLYSSWHWLWLSLVGIIFFRHIGVEIGAHRYFAHKSFKAKPWAKKLMAICGLFAYGGTHYAWIPFHRLHHQKSDTKLDPHSPHHMSFIDVYFTNWRVEVLDVKLYQDLIEDNAFKQWVIVNSIYDASIKDENNDDFNRMLYFLFDRAKGNMGQLINNYDINVKLNSAGQLEDMSLVVVETETYEESNG